MSLPTLAIVLLEGEGNALADGKYPLKLRVTYKRKPRYIGLGLAAHPHRWHKGKERFTARAPDHEMLNFDLDDYMFQARNILRSFREKKQHFSFEVFKQKFLRQNKEVTVAELFDIYAAEQKKAKTAQYYVASKKAVLNFCKTSEPLFTDIDYDWLKQYELHFTRRGKKGLAYMIALKTICGEAVKRGIAEQSWYPFQTQWNLRGYSFAHLRKKKKKRKTHFRVLSPEEIMMMKSFPIDKHPELAEGYDYFMCSYFCFGLNLKDIILLEKNDIEGDLIFWDRSKTGIEGGAELRPALLKILSRYQNKSKYLFPNLSRIPDGLPPRQFDELVEEVRCNLNRRINKKLLKITKILGIEKFTFYSARDTAASHLLRQGYKIVDVSEVLTHANVSTTDAHYNDGIDVAKIRELAGAL